MGYAGLHDYYSPVRQTRQRVAVVNQFKQFLSVKSRALAYDDYAIDRA